MCSRREEMLSAEPAGADPPLRQARVPTVVRALSALTIVAIPLVLVGNSVWLLLGPWFVDIQYALPGFPVDPNGVQGPARSELAKVGISSVRPIGEGVDLLREARLPDGDIAFTEREISHMADVREVMSGLLAIWLAAGVSLAGALFGLSRFAAHRSRARALVRGALVTVGAMSLVGLFMAFAFEIFFDGFHRLFFSEGTWQFADRYTLRQLYPDAFWGIAGATVAIMVLLQAGVLALIGHRLATRYEPRGDARRSPSGHIDEDAT